MKNRKWGVQGSNPAYRPKCPRKCLFDFFRRTDAVSGAHTPFGDVIPCYDCATLCRACGQSFILSKNVKKAFWQAFFRASAHACRFDACLMYMVKTQVVRSFLMQYVHNCVQLSSHLPVRMLGMEAGSTQPCVSHQYLVY